MRPASSLLVSESGHCAGIGCARRVNHQRALTLCNSHRPIPGETWTASSGEHVHIERAQDGTTTFRFGVEQSATEQVPTSNPNQQQQQRTANGGSVHAQAFSSAPQTARGKRYSRSRSSVRSNSATAEIHATSSNMSTFVSNGSSTSLPGPRGSSHSPSRSTVAVVTEELDGPIIHDDVPGASHVGVSGLGHSGLATLPPDSISYVQRLGGANGIPGLDQGPWVPADQLLGTVFENTSSSNDSMSEDEWDSDLFNELPPLKSASTTSTDGKMDKGSPREQLLKQQRKVDVSTAEALFLLRAFSDLSRLGQLDKAKKLVEEIVKAERHDVLPRLRHKHFLKAAAERKAVKQAFRFVQVLPRQYVDARTYNMLVSVCVAAGDLRGAMAAADMLISTGRKLDTKLYTNLITACARVGATDQAFHLYDDMRREKVKVDKHVASALISCCTRTIAQQFAGDRRQQIVCMERAFSVLDDMYRMHITPDTAVWNALIVAAGRTGMLDRAFQVVTDMGTERCDMDAATYACMVDACARCGRSDLAMEMFHTALQLGFSGSIQLYAAAINACANSEHSNIDAAMDVFQQMDRHCVKADGLLYGSLIVAAGKAGRLDVVFLLQQKMREEGVKPSQETCSAVILACVANGELAEARSAYRSARSLGLAPGIKACNSLMNAYGRAGRLGDVVSLLADMISAGLKADSFTYSAILNTCQRADAAELAFEVVRVMKEQHVKMDESHCFVLLRLCYNRLRSTWSVGGYPPRAPSDHPQSPLPIDRSQLQEGQLLLQLLSGKEVPAAAKAAGGYDCSRSKWVSRAIAVYREALSAGMQPSMRVLDRLLACLRQPKAASEADADALQPSGYGDLPSAGGRVLLSRSVLKRMSHERWVGPEQLYDPRAVTLLEAAIFSGALPQFKLDGTSQVDMRCMLPAVAEAYLLAILNALQRRAGSLQHITTPITLLLPPFHPRNVFWPSYADRSARTGKSDSDGLPWEVVATREAKRNRRKASRAAAAEQAVQSSVDVGSGGSSESESESDEAAMGSISEANLAKEASALGVAGVLRSLGIRTSTQPDKGIVTIQPPALNRWLRDVRRHQQKQAQSSLAAGHSKAGKPVPDSGIETGVQGSRMTQGVLPGVRRSKVKGRPQLF